MIVGQYNAIASLSCSHTIIIKIKQLNEALASSSINYGSGKAYRAARPETTYQKLFQFMILATL